MSFSLLLLVVLLLLATTTTQASKDTTDVDDDDTTTPQCFHGSLEEVLLACRDHNCCTSSTSCYWADNTTVTICSDSCQGDYACDFGILERVEIQAASCIGDLACQGLHGVVVIEHNSCHGLQVCQDAHPPHIHSDTCVGYRACANIHKNVGKGECLQSWSCMPGVEKITQLSKFVTHSLIVALAFVLIVFLHPKPAPTALQQEQLQLTRST